MTAQEIAQLEIEIAEQERWDIRNAAERMGIPDNLKLAEYIRNLEREVGMLTCYVDERLRKIEAGADHERQFGF